MCVIAKRRVVNARRTTEGGNTDIRPCNNNVIRSKYIDDLPTSAVVKLLQWNSLRVPQLSSLCVCLFTVTRLNRSSYKFSWTYVLKRWSDVDVRCFDISPVSKCFRFEGVFRSYSQTPWRIVKKWFKALTGYNGGMRYVTKFSIFLSFQPFCWHFLQWRRRARCRRERTVNNSTHATIIHKCKPRLKLALGPLFVIMEYVPLGKLQSYLRNSRAQRHYDNMHATSATLTSRDLTSFCYQTARGMEFLSSKGVSPNLCFAFTPIKPQEIITIFLHELTIQNLHTVLSIEGWMTRIGFYIFTHKLFNVRFRTILPDDKNWLVVWWTKDIYGILLLCHSRSQ